MKKWMLAIITFLFISSFTTVWAMTADEKEAQMTIEDWFAAMKAEQLDKAASFLSPQFVSIHTDRIVRDKEQEMKLIKNLHMKDYHLTNFKFSHSGDIMVVTYVDQSAEKIDNQPIDTQPAGRMAVLQKQNKDKWIILAYANLDKID